MTLTIEQEVVCVDVEYLSRQGLQQDVVVALTLLNFTALWCLGSFFFSASCGFPDDWSLCKEMHLRS